MSTCLTIDRVDERLKGRTLRLTLDLGGRRLLNREIRVESVGTDPDDNFPDHLVLNAGRGQDGEGEVRVNRLLVAQVASNMREARMELVDDGLLTLTLVADGEGKEETDV